MIGFNGMIVTPHGHDARHPDGRRSSQCYFCIQAKSRKVVAAATGDSVYWVSLYCHKALNDEMIEALSEHPPGTLMIKPDHMGTIDGTTGWRKA